MIVRTDALVAAVIERTIEVAAVPAPTGEEHDRARLVCEWWASDGFAETHTDDAGNVWALARPGDGAMVVPCAHLDTVFPHDVPHGVRADGVTLVGPSVGDDSIGLAALGAAAGLVQCETRPIWLLASVGEEGLGNLRGGLAALETPSAEIGAFIAVEGNYLGRVSTVGLGAVRYRVTVTGPGGHAWEAADVPSAVHRAAEVIAAITSSPRAEGTSVNAGLVGGGEAINARAREAWFELDVRGDDPRRLAAVVAQVDAVLAGVEEPLRVERVVLGDRPAGRLRTDHPLARAARDALAEAGLDVASPATSTDANAAHAHGVPAIAVGVTTGAGEHTPEERIDVAPIGIGLRTLARTIERFEELSA
ncbi:MAG: M20/M25/M40 family metallo-hydrolase [Actinomycetota bacterium]